MHGLWTILTWAKQGALGTLERMNSSDWTFAVKTGDFSSQ